MFQCTKFNRLVVAGIAAAAIAPASAIASPAVDGGVSAPDQQDFRAPDQVAGGAPGTGVVVQDLRTPDQVDGSHVGRVDAAPPQWPVNPQPIVNAAPSTGTSDDGIDDTVLIALGGGALLLIGGLGVAGRKRMKVVRQRQLA